MLLVGNHSGGTLIADTFVFGQHFYDHFGPERRFHQLAHDLVFKVPGLRALRRALRHGAGLAGEHGARPARDAALLVYPGGDHETYRPSWESEQIDFAGRTGFVKLALEARGPDRPGGRRSAARRPRCSSGRGDAWRARCSSTAASV